MVKNQIGRDLSIAIKATAGKHGPALVIPINSPPEAFLRPVATRKELLNADDVRLLTDWRNRFVQSFLTEFQATESRTARWLVEVVGPNEGKILFMVDDPSGRTFGYMGLDFIDWVQGAAEADAIVRGAESVPGTMTRALQTMLGWARSQLGLHKIGVRVRSDNTALEFYRKIGFDEIRRLPLRRIVEKEVIRWIEDESLQSAEVYLVHMLWSIQNEEQSMAEQKFCEGDEEKNSY